MLSALVNRGANLSADHRTMTMSSPTVQTGGAGIAIGQAAFVQNAMGHVVIGGSAYSQGISASIVMGTSAYTNCKNSVVIGTGAMHTAGGTDVGGVTIGDGAYQSTMYNESSVVIGRGAGISGYTGYGVRIGNLSGGYGQSSIAIGHGAFTPENNQFVAGGPSTPVNSVYFGNGTTNSAPSSATIQPTGGNGSNVKGADIAIAGGRHTGTPTTGTAGHVKLQTSLVGAAAWTPNSLVDRYIVKSARLALTDATNVNVFDVALPTLKGCMGTIRYEIFCTDGTDVQVRRGQMQYSAVNKAGVYTSEVAVLNEAASCSTGTLTATWDILTGTDKITLRVNADTSLTPTTFYLTYTLENNSEQAITIL